MEKLKLNKNNYRKVKNYEIFKNSLPNLTLSFLYRKIIISRCDTKNVAGSICRGMDKSTCFFRTRKNI